MKVKLFGINMDIEWLIMWLISALAELLDKVVDGAKMNLKEKKATRTVHYLAKEWGVYVAGNTETDIDDKGIEKLIDKAKDTADEGGFELVTIPELSE